MSKFLVPIQLPDLTGPLKLAPEAAFTKVYTRRGSLILLRPDGQEVDAVLDRRLDGFTPPAKGGPVTATDTVLQALAKLQQTAGSLALTGDVVGQAAYNPTTGQLEIDTRLNVEVGQGGDAVTTEPIDVRGVSVGNLTDGTRLPQGLDLTEVLKQMLVRRTGPQYAAPSASLSHLPVQLTYEVGTLLTNVTLQIDYLRGDAGVATSYLLSEGTRPVSTSARYVLPELLISTTARTFTGSVQYAAGVAKPDNLGQVDPQDPGKLPAGQISAGSVRYEGVFPWFYGSSATPEEALALNLYQQPGKRMEAVGSRLEVPSFGNGPRFLWFAVPAGSQVFHNWYRTALDNGSIGAPSDLFGSARRVSVRSMGLALNWTQDYDFYLANSPTEANVYTLLS